MAATSLGASHLVLSPRAGMLYGSALLWLVFIVHVLKYPAFEHGPRYALATGRSLVEGYAKVPGPRRWAVWCFVLFTGIQGVAVAVAVTSVAASALRVSVGGLSLSSWGVVVATVVLGLLWLGRFPAMEAANKVMMGVLALVTVSTFLSSPPSAGAWVEGMKPMLPEGSVVLAAAIVGWLPTGLDVSVWHSLWALEVESRWRAEGETDDAAGNLRRLKRGLLDMRVGYGASFVLAVLFLFLGAQVPLSIGKDAEGARVALSISQAYASILGPWIVPVFMTAAFVGMFATAYIVMDGFPRAFAEGLRVALGRADHEGDDAQGEDAEGEGGEERGERSSRGDPSLRHGALFRRVYWVGLVTVWATTCLIHFAWPRPVFLALVGALLGLGVSPLYYVLNHYCVKRHITDERFLPHPVVRGMSWVGIVFVTVALAFWVGVQLW